MINRIIEWATRAYATDPKDPVVEAPASQQLVVYSATVINRSAGAADIGLIKSVNSVSNKFFTDVGGTKTDVSAALKASENVTILNAQNDKFYVGSLNAFGLIGLIVQTAGAGTYTLKYWNGTGFTALTAIVFSASAIDDTGNYDHILFIPPHDWVAGGTGLDNDKFWIEIENTNVAPIAAVISGAIIGEILSFRPAVSANSGITISAVDSEKPLMFQSEEGLIPYFGTPDAKNLVEISYSSK